MSDYYAPRTPAALGDPAQDPPLTIRVHLDDDPRDPAAWRAIKASVPGGPHWVLVVGLSQAGIWRSNDEVATWPVQHWLDAATVFGHAEAADRRQGRGPLRGDMDVTAFRTESESAEIAQSGLDRVREACRRADPNGRTGAEVEAALHRAQAATYPGWPGPPTESEDPRG